MMRRNIKIVDILKSMYLRKEFIFELNKIIKSDNFQPIQLVDRGYFHYGGYKMQQNKVIKSRILIEVDMNEDKEIILKLNKICAELNLSLETVIRESVINLYNEIEFLGSFRSIGR